MASTDFLFVGCPHDPNTISGSDPHDSTDNANLIAWYRPHHDTTIGPFYQEGTHNAGNYATPNKITQPYIPQGYIDCSKNSKGIHPSTPSKRNIFTTRYDSFSYPAEAGFHSHSADSIQSTTDELEFLQAAAESFTMKTGQLGAKLYTENTGRYKWADEEMWPEPYHTNRSTANQHGETRRGGVMPSMTVLCLQNLSQSVETGHKKAPIKWGSNNYGSTDTTPGRSDYQSYWTFTCGLEAAKVGSDFRKLMWTYADEDGTTGEYRGDQTEITGGWVPWTFDWQNPPGDTSDRKVRTYLYGDLDDEVAFGTSTTTTIPYFHAGKGAVYLNGDSANYSNANDGADRGTINAVSDMMFFSGSLSNIRRQQMEKYLADKANVDLTNTTYLSEFQGGKEGEAHPHSAIGYALTDHPIDTSSPGTYCRRFRHPTTGGAAPKIHYETAAGAFVKSGSYASVFQNPTGSTAIRMQAFVRCENIADATDNEHGGSQIALVAKATTPFGNQLDHIKGYALKFGTFKDGVDTNLKFRLSLRSSDRWEDGTTYDDNGDIDLAPTFTVTASDWYQMRLDVVPFGNHVDMVKAYARTGSAGSWETLTTQFISGSDSNYRANVDDFSFFSGSIKPTGSKGTVNHPDPVDTATFGSSAAAMQMTTQPLATSNGKRNTAPKGKFFGYYCSMSSSSGDTLTTEYMLDDFQIFADQV